MVRATSSPARQADLLSRWPERGWAALWAACLAGILAFPGWQDVPFYLIWISLAVLYGFRDWPAQHAICLSAGVAGSTAAAIGLAAGRSGLGYASLGKVALMAAMFSAMIWHTERRRSADADRCRVSAENERLLTAQRRFLQDASHQLRAPLAIALGHAELLASALSEPQQRRDIHVVVGELDRLRKLSERLLLIAASENPEFLRPEPVALERLIMELLRRWRPTARRQWQLGRLDQAVVQADRERLRLAMDALLENAIQHTADDDVIRLSVLRDPDGSVARMVIEDSGEGIATGDLDAIFDRFRTGAGGGPRGTGLGLALAQAVARGHDGELQVQSVHGEGSRFELALPVAARPAGATAAALPVARPAAAQRAIGRQA